MNTEAAAHRLVLELMSPTTTPERRRQVEAELHRYPGASMLLAKLLQAKQRRELERLSLAANCIRAKSMVELEVSLMGT